jgi:hypothetical protein
VFKEHIVDLPFRPVRDNPAEGAARLGRRLGKLEKVDVFIHRHAVAAP